MKYKLYYWDFLLCRSFIDKNPEKYPKVNSKYGNNEPEFHNDTILDTPLGHKVYMLIDEDDAMYLKLRYPLQDLTPKYEV